MEWSDICGTEYKLRVWVGHRWLTKELDGLMTSWPYCSITFLLISIQKRWPQIVCNCSRSTNQRAKR